MHQNFRLALLAAAALAVTPAFAAGHGGAGGMGGGRIGASAPNGTAGSFGRMGGMNGAMTAVARGGAGADMHINNAPNTHGSAVSSAAHSAQLGGNPVGPQVRTVARSNSQGPAHASTTAVANVNKNGASASNSVIASGGSGTSKTANTGSNTTSTLETHGTDADADVSGGTTNHGSTVSAAAHAAHTSGSKVGPQVRSVARSKSQGPAHANSRAITRVDAHTQSGANSVLASGNANGTTTSVATEGTAPPQHNKTKVKNTASRTTGSGDDAKDH